MRAGAMPLLGPFHAWPDSLNRGQELARMVRHGDVGFRRAFGAGVKTFL